jgi:hypothetical protein
VQLLLLLKLDCDKLHTNAQAANPEIFPGVAASDLVGGTFVSAEMRGLIFQGSNMTGAASRTKGVPMLGPSADAPEFTAALLTRVINLGLGANLKYCFTVPS